VAPRLRTALGGCSRGQGRHRACGSARGPTVCFFRSAAAAYLACSCCYGVPEAGGLERARINSGPAGGPPPTTPARGRAVQMEAHPGIGAGSSIRKRCAPPPEAAGEGCPGIEEGIVSR